VSIDPGHAQTVTIDLNQASDLMQKRCSKCHNLDRVVGARKDAHGWGATVERMQAMTGAGISKPEAQTIVAFLSSQNRPQGSQSMAKMEVARALVDQRCGRCHGLDRVYKAVQTPAEWRETVARMVGYAAGSTGELQPGEDRQIVDYLADTQTPEAAAKRKADAAALAGRSLIAVPAAQVPFDPTAEASRYDGRTIAFVSAIFVAVVILAIRKPRTRAASREVPVALARTAAPPRAPAAPFVLELVQITQQTRDSKTLRFAVGGERKLEALPGQFLTFSFLFDGKRATRCYSICSSAARSGYVEIAPKRVDNGCVSVFLNDRVSVGTTVEATGPFGQFYLDPERDRKIVLIAAGSGITPMIAMLRYLDDLCRDTDTTLLYCVRTADDIMFRQELDELQGRLKNFRSRVLLSQPLPEWTGARGHISLNFISESAPDSRGRVFFLCGPPPFMEATKALLAELGVDPANIRQETFGGGAAVPKALGFPFPPARFSVEFAQSGKTVTVAENESLLSAAAAAGVDIPSACRQGQCGTCKKRLLDGHVEMTCENGLDPESKARGYVLTCVGRATGNVRLDA
jgi:ferredoxin-NADP reductase